MATKTSDSRSSAAPPPPGPTNWHKPAPPSESDKEFSLREYENQRTPETVLKMSDWEETWKTHNRNAEAVIKQNHIQSNSAIREIFARLDLIEATLAKLNKTAK